MLKSIIIVCHVLYLLVCLNFFQWKGYYVKRYLKYLFKNKQIITLNILLFLQIASNLTLKHLKISIFAINLVFYTFILINLILFIIKSKKIKFIFTARIFRIILLDLIIIILSIPIKNSYNILILILTPIILIVLNFLDVYRYVLNNKKLHSSISKLESNKHLITIGITGSNGKTTVKEILVKILSKKFNVISTQKNQNTPKGAIIAINKFLTQNTEIFVCEMGAKKRGDIKEICNLVNPSKGIITNVAPQHLETFKTEQNVYFTKKELSDYLGENYCVFNLDNPQTSKMFNEKSGDKSGVSINKKTALYADNIKIINYETYFDIYYQNQAFPCHTKLLGTHNISNILLALDMALHLGINISSAIQTIINLNPTPHRLEYIKSHIDIIDDTYNCSIESASSALEFLSKIDKIKVVCTPGIVEGGRKQFSLNQQLSKLLNHIADIVIIVGKTNRKALVSKLNKFEILSVNAKNINTIIQHPEIAKQKKSAYIVDTLNAAKLVFTKILNSNHVLLLLNDLPDEYN